MFFFSVSFFLIFFLIFFFNFLIEPIKNFYKFLLINSLLTCIFIILIIYIYIVKFNYLNIFFFFKKNTYTYHYLNIYIDYFGKLLLFISVLVSFLSLIILMSRNSILIYLFIFFIILSFLLVNTKNFFICFLAYEFLLIPSFILSLYLSYNQRVLYASIIFLIWTQIGSFFFLAFIIYIFNNYLISNTYTIFFTNQNLLKKKNLLFLLFISFGFKVPIWPFHFWLTKIHVEASSGFSIFLSGFLVKTSIYLFYKFYILLQIYNISIIYYIVLYIGVIDSSLKFWCQSDLKKIIAYTTIQEMNIIFLLTLLKFKTVIPIMLIFIYMHSLLSSLLFWIIDLIYKRFKSRNVYQIGNLSNLTPNLYNLILISIFIYIGVPISLKFYVEFNFFFTLFLYDMNVSLILGFIIITIANLSFSKNFFIILYKNNMVGVKIFYIDLLKNEIYLLGLLISLVVIKII